MPQITFPTDTADTIDAIRHAIGRMIVVDIPHIEECTVCSLDPTTNTSTNSFCPVCSGLYFIPVLSGYSVESHITWGPSDNLAWVTGGQLLEGECRIQIKYTPQNLLAVLSGINYHVDDKVMYKDTYVLRGAPELNRIIVNLKERGNDE